MSTPLAATPTTIPHLSVSKTFVSSGKLLSTPLTITSRTNISRVSMPRLEGSPPPRQRQQPMMEKIKAMPGDMQRRYDALSPGRKVSPWRLSMSGYKQIAD